ncbi:MAG TPA: ABC transporter ATP-binding protein [Candidatus Dormibacteraeota bacterium]
MVELRLEGVTFAYPGNVSVFAAPGISLRLQSGATALVGENGAGKTTLTKLLNGLLRPDTGTIDAAGGNVADRTVAQMASVIGYAFQNPDDQLFQRTVYDEVAFGPRAMKRAPDRIHTAVDEALERCGLSGEAKTHPHDLGLPERKWVTIASALAAEPPVLVFDEPTLGQDWAAKQRLKALLDWLVGSDRLILIVSHDMDFVAEACASTVVLTRGVVRYVGPTVTAFRDTTMIQEAGLELPATTKLGMALGMNPPPVGESAFLKAISEQKRGA